MHLILCSALLTLSGWVQPQFNDGLIYTTRDYYFDLPDGCLKAGNCIADFYLIVEMNIAVTMKDEVKQASFSEAKLHFDMGRDQRAHMPLTMKVQKAQEPRVKEVVLLFEPQYEKENTYRPIRNCTFTGTVKEKGGMSGTFTFYFSDGSASSYNYQ